MPGGQVHKDFSYEANVQPDVDKLQGLAEDRVQLAERLMAVLTRHCGRLEYDINRIRVASGEAPLPNSVVTPAFEAAPPSLSLRGSNVAETRGVAESARMGSITLTPVGSISLPEPAPSPPAVTLSGGPAVKRKNVLLVSANARN